MIKGYEALRARASLTCTPLSAHLELTYRCNARCAHCFQTSHTVGHELSEGEWLSTVDQVRKAGILILTLSGGEPLLSPHFWPVAEHARARGLALRVFTNGTLLTREYTERVARLRPLSVEISIFSLRPEAHDAVTGVPGSLAKAIRGLFRLKRAAVPMVVKCPLLAPTATDYTAVLRLAERLGASSVLDPQISPRSDGGTGPILCRSDDQTIEEYFADPASPARLREASAPVAADRAPCGMGRTSLVISPEGDVLPCPVLRTPAGNVHDAPLTDIWANSPLFKRLRARRFGNLVPCGTCPRSSYCGRCSAIALLEDGNLDGPSSRACRIAELRERAWGLPVPEGVPQVIPGAGKAAGD